MPQFNHTVAIPAKNEVEAIKKQAALAIIAANITAENLELLADKSKKAGINLKIQTFKNLI